LNRRSISWGLGLISAAMVAVGLAWTLRSYGMLRKTAGRIDVKCRHLEQLQDVGRGLARYEACRAAFEALPRKQAVPLDALVARILGPVQPDDSRETREEVLPGWVLRKRELVFNSIAVGAVVSFVRAAESADCGEPGDVDSPASGPVQRQCPPWRLGEFVLKASGSAGQAQVVLVLETLEQAGGPTGS